MKKFALIGFGILLMATPLAPLVMTGLMLSSIMITRKPEVVTTSRLFVDSTAHNLSAQSTKVAALGERTASSPKNK